MAFYPQTNFIASNYILMVKSIKTKKEITMSTFAIITAVLLSPVGTGLLIAALIVLLSLD